MKSVEYIILITAGRGPEECSWVVPRVLEKIQAEAKSEGLNIKLVNSEASKHDNSLLSVTLNLSGKKAEEFIEKWKGSIQWIAQSPFRKFHKRKNWFISVASKQIIKPAQIKPSEISYQTLRSGGPGGQHVNKVSTAVRATHTPTGISVMANDSRSQIQNKKLATQRLFDNFEKEQIKFLLDEQRDLWDNHNSVKRGNPIRTFKGEKFIEIKKHKK